MRFWKNHPEMWSKFENFRIRPSVKQMSRAATSARFQKVWSIKLLSSRISDAFLMPGDTREAAKTFGTAEDQALSTKNVPSPDQLLRSSERVAEPEGWESRSKNIWKCWNFLNVTFYFFVQNCFLRRLDHALWRLDMLKMFFI